MTDKVSVIVDTINNVVKNVMIVDPVEYPPYPNELAIEVDPNDPHPIGSLYNPTTGEFTRPSIDVIIPESITRRQCAKLLFNMQLITGSEALSMTQSGIPPAAIMTYIDNMQEPDKTNALLDFAADTYVRNNPLLLTLAQVNNMNESDMDQFFIAAAQL